MMSKDAYYFSHDSNAKTDPEILKLRQRYGWEGYGIYWALVEMLRDANGYELETQYEVYAFALQADCETLRAIIEDFNLFTVSDCVFFSESLKRRMAKKDEKSAQARKAALKRWECKADEMPNHGESNTDAMRPHCASNAIKGKERKGKEIKEKESTAKKFPHGEFKNVFLTAIEHEKLKDKFNGRCLDRVNALSEYMKSKGKAYKDHYATILAWARKEERDGKEINTIPSCMRGGCK